VNLDEMMARLRERKKPWDILIVGSRATFALVEQSDFGNVGQALACRLASAGLLSRSGNRGRTKVRRKLKLAPRRLVAERLVVEQFEVEQFEVEQLLARQLVAEQLAPPQLLARRHVEQQLVARQLAVEPFVAEQLPPQQLTGSGER
jgi:hypothetical protein